MANPVANEAEMKAKVFISYSRKDIAFADRLEPALKARGFDVLIDRTEIYALEDWWKRIEVLITKADTVVFVLSPDAVASEVALKEVAFAASLNKRFAPIVVRRVEDKTVPEALRRLNFIFFDDAARVESSMERLADALTTDIDWVRKHTEFSEQAQRWAKAGRPGPSGLLLHSPLLEEAEGWIASRPQGAPEPTPTTWAFIAESRKHENALIAEAKSAQKRKRRLEYAFMGILVVISLAGITYAIWTNFDYLKVHGEMIADGFWPKNLTAETERSYAQMILQPGQIVSFRECSGCSEMVVVPKGEFIMGSPATEEGRTNAEGPQHKVTIASNFAVSKFEVTFDEWKDCVDARVCEVAFDQRWGRGNRPVIDVSWDDAQQYAKWLSERTGRPYRLLSEAEWEYAARAGSTTAYSWGNEIGKGNANCVGCGSQWDGKRTAPVGSFAANAFGLHDMHGNVWEWVQDCLNENYNGAPINGSARTDGTCTSRVLRGGSWIFAPRTLRSADRLWGPAVARHNNLGFRLGRTLSATAGAISVVSGAQDSVEMTHLRHRLPECYRVGQTGGKHDFISRRY